LGAVVVAVVVGGSCSWGQLQLQLQLDMEMI